MKQFLRLVLCMVTMSALQHVHAQGQAYNLGDKVIQAGFGLGGGFYEGSIKVPPVQARFDYGLKENISIGGVIGYASSSNFYDDPFSGSLGRSSIDYSYLIIAGRGNYHFATSEKLDPYFGLTLGYNKIGFSDTGGYLGSAIATSGFLYGAQIGANYYFKPNIGAWADIGYGLGIINLGLALKL